MMNHYFIITSECGLKLFPHAKQILIIVNLLSSQIHLNHEHIFTFLQNIRSDNRMSYKSALHIWIFGDSS